MALSPFICTETADPVGELTARAAHRRPDLATAFDDDGWIAVRIPEVVLNHAGLAFSGGDLALARPAAARHASDFIAFSERLSSLVGLRHGEHFRFLDEAAA